MSEPEKIPCPTCNRHPGSSPVGVVLDGNGRTTSCWDCKGTGWLKRKDAEDNDLLRHIADESAP